MFLEIGQRYIEYRSLSAEPCMKRICTQGASTFATVIKLKLRKGLSSSFCVEVLKHLIHAFFHRSSDLARNGGISGHTEHVFAAIISEYVQGGALHRCCEMTILSCFLWM